MISLKKVSSNPDCNSEDGKEILGEFVKGATCGFACNWRGEGEAADVPKTASPVRTPGKLIIKIRNTNRKGNGCCY